MAEGYPLFWIFPVAKEIRRRFTGSAGFGLVTSRVQVEGPITKDKTSFIFGGRTTYANWLLNLLPDEYDKSKASFQDINLNDQSPD